MWCPDKTAARTAHGAIALQGEVVEHVVDLRKFALPFGGRMFEGMKDRLPRGSSRKTNAHA